MHKDYKGNPLFIYLFILFSYFCARANTTKEVCSQEKKKPYWNSSVPDYALWRVVYTTVPRWMGIVGLITFAATESSRKTKWNLKCLTMNGEEHSGRAA